ncbi:MAG: hypothetical protein J1F63_05930 [Oscillospiraceae bacterium]|nr:hypothetical protein [Oscillospiraceae bacterium]
MTDVEEVVAPRRSGVDNNGKSGIIKMQAVSGALSPNSDRAQKHAAQYYEAVRHMKTDSHRISENTDYTVDEIQAVKEYVFLTKHDLGGNEKEFFFPSFEMAQSWQRLIDGKDIQPHDLTLLKHEMMEMNLIQQGYSQDEAHRRTSELYNYKKESDEYYAKIDQHK